MLSSLCVVSELDLIIVVEMMKSMLLLARRKCIWNFDHRHFFCQIATKS